MMMMFFSFNVTTDLRPQCQNKKEKKSLDWIPTKDTNTLLLLRALSVEEGRRFANNKIKLILSWALDETTMIFIGK
jgi:hypothetical protein